MMPHTVIPLFEIACSTCPSVISMQLCEGFEISAATVTRVAPLNPPSSRFAEISTARPIAI